MAGVRKGTSEAVARSSLTALNAAYTIIKEGQVHGTESGQHHHLGGAGLKPWLGGVRSEAVARSVPTTLKAANTIIEEGSGLKPWLGAYQRH